MKKILLIIPLVTLGIVLKAQQEPLFTMYMHNVPALDPAAAGVSGTVCGSFFGRDQWMGFKDQEGDRVNPQTYGITLDMPVYAIKSGVGLTVAYDKLGFEKNLDIKVLYAYHYVFPNNSMLSAGLSFGILNKTIDFSKLHPSGEDPSITSYSIEKGTLTDFGFGVHYNIPRKLYAGLSVKNLLGSSAEIGGPDFKLARHYYLFGGYDIILIDRRLRHLVLTPGALIKATKGAIQADLNAIVSYNNLVWGGIVYRTTSVAGLMAGVRYNGLMVGLAYDYTLNNDFAKGSRGSLEVIVKYCYPIYPGVIKKSGYNTRNL